MQRLTPVYQPPFKRNEPGPDNGGSIKPDAATCFAQLYSTPLWAILQRKNEPDGQPICVMPDDGVLRHIHYDSQNNQLHVKLKLTGGGFICEYVDFQAKTIGELKQELAKAV